MPIIGPFYLSNTEIDVLSKLFVFRSGTVEQVTYMIQPEIADEGFINDNHRRSTYTGRIKYISNTLSNLTKKGIVNFMKTPHSMKKVFYLSVEGLNTVYTIHGIEEHASSLASGWDGDYGYFDYSLYKPSQDRFAHHDLSVNFHLQMLHYATKKGFVYEFIDNRYASREFSTIKQTKKIKRYFRPDGEFKINSQNHFWLEIDMSTERGEKLADKFEAYREYLDVISEGISFSEMNETPRSIVFHSSASYITVRWVSVLNAFMSKMEQYTPLINFRLSNNSTLEQAAMAESNSEMHLAAVRTNLKNYLKTESGFSGPPVTRSNSSSFIKLIAVDEESLGWSPNLILTNNPDGTIQILLFERFEGLESLGIARIIDFNKKFLSLEIGKSSQIREIVPILYYYETNPEVVPYKGAGVDLDMRRLFNKLIFHDAKNNLWFDGNDKSIIHGNPLMFRCN
ncbi:replication-relaxation family protein [Paenibacillus periandrae]|uniref:replication-relaxation family protein n=1 Tax=Paenibacillus periandrae TaxID=1761741 RepID=UPI001F09AE85|nr:replication-relaxation family protein [Paenibacillus periandrae]